MAGGFLVAVQGDTTRLQGHPIAPRRAKRTLADFLAICAMLSSVNKSSRVYMQYGSTFLFVVWEDVSACDNILSFKRQTFARSCTPPIEPSTPFLLTTCARSLARTFKSTNFFFASSVPCPCVCAWAYLVPALTPSNGSVSLSGTAAQPPKRHERLTRNGTTWVRTGGL